MNRFVRLLALAAMVAAIAVDAQEVRAGLAGSVSDSTLAPVPAVSIVLKSKVIASGRPWENICRKGGNCAVVLDQEPARSPVSERKRS